MPEMDSQEGDRLVIDKRLQDKDAGEKKSKQEGDAEKNLGLFEKSPSSTIAAL